VNFSTSSMYGEDPLDAFPHPDPGGTNPNVPTQIEIEITFDSVWAMADFGDEALGRVPRPFRVIDAPDHGGGSDQQ
jgi:hypothetical protein